MKDLRSLLPSAHLESLRASYRHEAMVAATVGAVTTLAPQLAAWNEGIARAFYDAAGPLAPADRERCLIALISCTGTAMPLSTHVYWGLMEGLSIDEVLQIVALAGCYGGLPRSVFGMEVVARVLAVLGRVPASGAAPASVIAALVSEFSPRL